MAKLTIYLHFDGNCEEAFNHYKRIFGVELSGLIRYGDIPSQGGMPALPASDLNKIENVSMQIDKDTSLMGSDSLEAFGQKTIVGNNFSIYIEADTKGQADSFFNGLSECGLIKMPMTTAHWGDYFGMCTDKYGVSWLINHAQNARA